MAGNHTKETSHKTSNMTPESWMIELWQWADEHNIEKHRLPRNSEDLLKLKRLSVWGDSITQLPDGVFNLSRLESLTFVSKTFVDISEKIGQLKQLSYLHLKGDFRVLPNSLFELSNLKYLNVSSDSFTQLSDDIEKLQNLETLEIISTTFADISEKIGQLKQLSYLHLKGDFRVLPNSLFELSNLQQLTLSSDSFIQLPDAIEKLQNLETFDIISNQLTCISHRIGQLSCLKTLWLRCPNLEHLPSSMAQLTSLTALGVDSQKISDLLVELPEHLIQRFRDKTLCIYRSHYRSAFGSLYTPSLNYDHMAYSALIDINDDWNEEKLSALKVQTDARIIIALQTTKHIKPIVSPPIIDSIIHCDTTDITAIEALFDYDITTAFIGMDISDFWGFIRNQQVYYISSEGNIDPTIFSIKRAQQAVDEIISKFPNNLSRIWVHVDYANEATTFVEADEINDAFEEMVSSDILECSWLNTRSNSSIAQSDYYTIKVLCVVG